MIVRFLVATWLAVYAVAATLAIVRAFRRNGSNPSDGDARFLLLRPLAGLEPGLAERLLETGGAQEVVFAVGTLEDLAAPVACAASAELRRRGIEARVVVTGARGPNHKVDQLARALAATVRVDPYPVVVVADSDVDLAGDAAVRLVGSMGTADAAWAPPVERGDVATWGDRASHAVLDASLHSFPLLASIDHDGFVGKFFAVRREALDRIGGFEVLKNFLGEDVELARRLRQIGARIVVAPFVARAMASGRTFPSVVARYSRWLMVVRAQRPHLLASYPFLLATSPLFATLLALSLALQDPILAVHATFALLVRLAVACASRALAGLRLAPAEAFAQSFLGDATLLAALVRSLPKREVTWRGRRLLLSRGGVLSTAEHANEKLGREVAEEARPFRQHAGESKRNHVDAALKAGVNASELALNAPSLTLNSLENVALGGKRMTERDPQIRKFSGSEDVAEADRQHDGALAHARDLGGARLEVEDTERRPFATFGEHPKRSPFLDEKLRGVTNRPRSRSGIVEVHAEGSDASEKGSLSQVRSVHEGVAVRVEKELGHVKCDEGIPPRGVVRHEKHGRFGHGGASGLEAADEDATEGFPDATTGVPCEPRVEPSTFRRFDHGDLS